MKTLLKRIFLLVLWVLSFGGSVEAQERVYRAFNGNFPKQFQGQNRHGSGVITLGGNIYENIGRGIDDYFLVYPKEMIDAKFNTLLDSIRTLNSRILTVSKIRDSLDVEVKRLRMIIKTSLDSIPLKVLTTEVVETMESNVMKQIKEDQAFLAILERLEMNEAEITRLREVLNQRNPRN